MAKARPRRPPVPPRTPSPRGVRPPSSPARSAPEGVEGTIEQAVGRLLWAGVVLSGLLFALGLGLSLAGGPVAAGSAPVIMAGVAVLLLTPALRVLALLVHYVRIRDLDYILLTLFVLAMMAAGYLLGMA